MIKVRGSVPRAGSWDWSPSPQQPGKTSRATSSAPQSNRYNIKVWFMQLSFQSYISCGAVVWTTMHHWGCLSGLSGFKINLLIFFWKSGELTLRLNGVKPENYFRQKSPNSYFDFSNLYQTYTWLLVGLFVARCCQIHLQNRHLCRTVSHFICVLNPEAQRNQTEQLCLVHV